jgi:hypothetical protein
MLPRFLAVSTVVAALALTYAGAASADVPEGWSDPDDVSFMHTLLVLVGIPVLCFVVLALAVYLPSILRGESVAPAGARATDEWFGGRRDAHHSAQQALEQRKEAVADETGGASGSW